MNMRRIILVQLVVFGYGLWSIPPDNFHVEITAHGDLFTVRANGRQILKNTLPGHAGGKIGLTLTPIDSGIRVHFYNPLHPQGWRNLVVKDLATGKILATDYDLKKEMQKEKRARWFATYDDIFGVFTTRHGSCLYLGDKRWKDFALDVDFVNPYAGNIAVRVPDGGKGAVLSIRPFNNDIGWVGVENGGAILPMPSALIIKQIVSRLFCVYLIAVAIILALWAITIPAFFLCALIDICRLGPILSWPLKLFGRPRAARLGRAFGISIILLCAALFLALAIRIMVDCHEKIPHIQDSSAYLFQAKMHANGRFFVPAPSFIDSVNFEFMVHRDGKWYGKYPPGHPLVLTPGVVVGFPWIEPPILGFCSFLLLVVVAGRLYSFPVAVLSSLIAVASPFFVFLSASFMSHITCLLALLIFLYLVLRMEEGGRKSFAFWAGFALGWAFITRPLTAVAVAAPWLAWQAARIFRRGRRWESVKRLIVIGLGVAIPCGFQFWYNYHLTGDPLLPPFIAYCSFDRIGFGDGVASAHSFGRGLRILENTLFYLLDNLFGWPHYLTLVFISIPFILASENREDWLLLGSGVAISVAYIFYFARIQGHFGPRYWFEAMPAYIILSARGIVTASRSCGALAERLGKVFSRPRYVAIWPQVVSTAALMLLLGWLVRGYAKDYFPWLFREHHCYNDIDARIPAMARERNVHNAIVFVNPGAQWQNYGSVSALNSPRFDTDIIYARDLGREKNKKMADAFPGRSCYFADYQKREFRAMRGGEEKKEHILDEAAAVPDDETGDQGN